MQVGLGRERDGETAFLSPLQIGARMARRVDDQGSPVAQIDQIGRIAEALVDDGGDQVHIVIVRPGTDACQEII